MTTSRRRRPLQKANHVHFDRSSRRVTLVVRVLRTILNPLAAWPYACLFILAAQRLPWWFIPSCWLRAVYEAAVSIVLVDPTAWDLPSAAWKCVVFGVLWGVFGFCTHEAIRTSDLKWLEDKINTIAGD